MRAMGFAAKGGRSRKARVVALKDHHQAEHMTTDMSEGDEFAAREGARRSSSMLQSEEPVTPQVPLVDQKRFTVAMSGLVLLNLVSLGIETDVGEVSETFSLINLAFLGVYSLELLVRMVTYGPRALRDRCTVVDTVAVSVAVAERVSTSSGFARVLPVFRLLRLLRHAQDLRILRTERELWILVMTMKTTAKSLFWFSLILFFGILACASFARYTIGESAEWVGTMDPLVEHEPFEPFDNRQYFGTVARSYLTLLQVVTGSQWADMARRVILVYPLTFLFFVCFVFAFTHGFANCMIANFVQAARHIATVAEEAREEIEREGRTIVGEKIMDILSIADKDMDDICRPEELDRALRKSKLKFYMEDLNVPDLDGAGIISLFDRRGDGQVSNHRIVQGFIRMDESTKKKDYLRITLWAESILVRTSALSDKVGGLSAKVHELRVTLEKAMDAMEYYQGTKEVSELRVNAIKVIRSAPPGEAPKLVGWRPPPEPKYPPGDESLMFTAFASKFVSGRGPFAPGAADEHGPRLAAKLKDVPPPYPKPEAKQEVAPGESSEDKYWLERNPEKDFMPGPSASLRTLRDLLT